MQIYDIIMLVVLGVAVGFGLWKGLAWQLASIGSLFLSYVVSYTFRGQVAGFISADPPWNIFLSMLILYVATALAIWVVFHIVSGVIDKLKLKEFDAQLGGLFGLAKGVVLCAVITLFAITLLGEEQKQHILGSHSGYCLAVGLDKLDGAIPQEWHDVVAPYLHPISERLGNKPHQHKTADNSPTPAAVPGVLPNLPALPIPTQLIPASLGAAPSKPAATVAGEEPIRVPSQSEPPPAIPTTAAKPPAVTIQPMPQTKPNSPAATTPAAPFSVAAPPPIPGAPAPTGPTWPATSGNYDPYAGPPAAAGRR